MIAFAWILFAAVLIGIFAFCWAVVRYYSDKHDSELFPLLITVLGLCLTFFCVFLIPVDIYAVSSTVDSNGNALFTREEINTRTEGIKIIYYILYCLVLVFAFMLIPFAYFYYEEDDEDLTIRQRIWGGCKYTIFLILIIIILFIIGLFLKPGDKPSNNTNAKEWATSLLDTQNYGESAITFVLACLTILGFLIWITYTAYGLSAFPIGIIKGRRHISEDVMDVQSNLGQTREKKKAIKSKYLNDKKISKKDASNLDLLERQERALSKQNARLEADNTGWRSVCSALKPFAFIFGIIFFLISLLIIASMLLTNIDKAVNSKNWCGSQCGFVLEYPKVFNPLDNFLTLLAMYFPMDYFVLGGIILYIFFSTLSGIIRINIRFLWVNLFKIRKRATPPQGLLLAAVILMLAILALNMEITTLAPQYASWGSQVYRADNDTLKPCSINAPQNSTCTMTQIGSIVNRIEIKMPFFGIVFFYGTWLFLAAFVIGAFIAAFKAKDSNVERTEFDEEEEEN